ncbi:trypsin-like serine peptidase [Hyalangium minutum]|uniref:trypsin-like serine peptidase n=1 Tax=Hyalangium minutum TaxID=394096 RepID=UPI0014706DAA|nr:trypsin-like serine protease [Hyalangium minutum]
MGMRGTWKAIVFATLCVGGLFAYGRCASRSTASRLAADAGAGPSGVDGGNASSPNLREGEVLPVDDRIDLSDGVEDLENQFAFATMVAASVNGGETFKCTGVLISPRVVLTAGHCVCPRHSLVEPGSDAQLVIDGVACAEEMEVTTITYFPRAESSDGPPGFRAQTYRAQVSVHPALKILLDAQPLVLSSHADLAVALLDSPVEDPSMSVRLADSEVKLGEVIRVAGYGLDAATDFIHGVRRSGQKEVKRLPAGGADEMVLAPHGEPLTMGSGELCLRQDKTGMSLVGLSGKGAGPMPGCTSVHLYREWLNVQIQKSITIPPRMDGGMK